MTDLKAKRERQARRLLRVCLIPISTPCLEGYVEGYEGGRLEKGLNSLCAIGHMGRPLVSPEEEERLCSLPARRFEIRHTRESNHIERIFEGWEAAGYTGKGFWSDGGSTWQERSTWIYDAVLEELARRASEGVRVREAEGVAQ